MHTDYGSNGYKECTSDNPYSLKLVIHKQCSKPSLFMTLFYIHMDTLRCIFFRTCRLIFHLDSSFSRNSSALIKPWMIKLSVYRYTFHGEVEVHA